VADAVCKFGFQADVAGGRQFHSCRSLHLVSSTDCLFKHCDFVLLASAMEEMKVKV
jgi:hypothetical protein